MLLVCVCMHARGCKHTRVHPTVLFLIVLIVYLFVGLCGGALNFNACVGVCVCVLYVLVVTTSSTEALFIVWQADSRAPRSIVRSLSSNPACTASYTVLSLCALCPCVCDVCVFVPVSYGARVYQSCLFGMQAGCALLTCCLHSHVCMHR